MDKKTKTKMKDYEEFQKSNIERFKEGALVVFAFTAIAASMIGTAFVIFTCL